MKKSVLAVALAAVCSLTPVFAAGYAEETRSSGELSFDRLLNKLTDEYSKGLQLPAPDASPEAVQAAEDGRYWVSVAASNSRERTRLLEAGVDIVEIKSDRVFGVVHEDLLPLLSRKGVVLLSKETLSRHLHSFRDFPAADAAYHNYKETTELLTALAAKNSDVASFFSIGKSVRGRDIWCFRINSTAKGADASGKPGAFYVGTHHAREHLSNEVPLLFAVWLMDNRTNPDVKKYIETLDIHIVPLLNPDGAEYDIEGGSYQWQRKNMRINPDKSIGVDLNRNYDSWFGGEGSSHYTQSDTYCGPSAFSEPETMAVKNLVSAHRNIKTLMTYHSYASTILYPWGGSEAEVENAKDRKVFIKMAQEMGRLTGYRPEKSSDMYVSTGDTADWAYDFAKIFAFTTELEGRGFYPGAAIIDKTVKSNIKAAAYMLSVTDNPYKTIQ